MCTTSHDRTASGPTDASGTPAPGTPGAAPPPLTPFSATPYPEIEVRPANAAFLNMLKSSITSRQALLGGPAQKVAWSILAFATNGQHLYAGIDDNVMHYSASMLKVAAMYAAHELLAAANRLARLPGPHRANPTAFFAELVTRFDSQIKSAALADVLAAATQLAAKLPTYRATPSYELIFDASAVGSATDPPIRFNADFLARMTNMIEWSDDPDSGECIRRLSYTYINGALMKAGLYDAGSSDGIWLAGDYSFGADPYARVQSVNDQLAAQVTTTRKMLRLFALVEKKLLVRQDNNDAAMRVLLAKAASHGGFFRLYNPMQPKPWTLELSKIGIGPLKTKVDVSSESQLLRWTNNPPLNPAAKGLTGDFMVCWQNLRGDIGQLAGVVEVFRDTFTKVLT